MLKLYFKKYKMSGNVGVIMFLMCCILLKGMSGNLLTDENVLETCDTS